MISLQPPTKEMVAEAVSNGSYVHKTNAQQYLKLQLRTVKELMDGKGIERHSNVAAADETFKNAPKAKAKGHRQTEMFQRPCSVSVAEPSKVWQGDPVPGRVPSDNMPDPPQPAPQPGVGIGPGCRARRMGLIKEFAKCLVSPAEHCPHAMAYGESRFCHHPQRELIIARTEAAERSSGG